MPQVVNAPVWAFVCFPEDMSLGPFQLYRRATGSLNMRSVFLNCRIWITSLLLLLGCVLQRSRLHKKFCTRRSTAGSHVNWRSDLFKVCPSIKRRTRALCQCSSWKTTEYHWFNLSCKCQRKVAIDGRSRLCCLRATTPMPLTLHQEVTVLMCSMAALTVQVVSK